MNDTGSLTKQTQKYEGQNTEWHMYVHTHNTNKHPRFSIVLPLRVSHSLACQLHTVRLGVKYSEYTKYYEELKYKIYMLYILRYSISKSITINWSVGGLASFIHENYSLNLMKFSILKITSNQSLLQKKKEKNLYRHWWCWMQKIYIRFCKCGVFYIKNNIVDFPLSSDMHQLQRSYL